MKTSGIEEFQNIRKKIMLRVIHQTCQKLLEKKITINPANVAGYAKELFEEEKIDLKYFIGKQSMGRNKEYRTVLEQYRNTQKHTKSISLQRTSTKYDEFELRDKYDLLSQDFIELLDKYKWLESQIKSLKKNNNSLMLKLQKQGIYNENPLKGNSLQKNIIETIKILVDVGATVILKNNDKIIIKSYSDREDKRYEFSLEEWDKFE